MNGHMCWASDIATALPLRHGAIQNIKAPWWGWLVALWRIPCNIWRRLWRKRIALDYEPKTDLLSPEQYFLRGHLYRQRLLRARRGNDG